MFYEGLGVEKHEEVAFAYYQLAADQKSAPAQYYLGVMLQYGYGVPKNLEEAFRLYQSVALLFADARYSLGVMFENGWGVEKNLEQALEHYQSAAAEGYSGAQAEVDRITSSIQMGAAQVSAAQGDADAQFSFAGMCYRGKGVDQSYDEALRYYRLAAEKGHAGAQFNLGVMYYKGEGVRKDPEKAAEYLQLAADKGYGKAKNALDIIKSRSSAANQP